MAAVDSNELQDLLDHHRPMRCWKDPDESSNANFPFSLAAYSAEDVPVTPSSTTKDSAPAPLLRIPQLEPIHGSSPSDLATSSELGGTTPHRIGNGGNSAMSEATNDGLARTPSAPRKNNEVSTSFESQWNYVKNCHATPATPNKVSQNTGSSTWPIILLL